MQHTENRIKLIEIDNSLHSRLQLDRKKGIYWFSCEKKNGEETAKELDYLYKTIATYSVFPCNIVRLETRPHSHIMLTMLIHGFGISGALFHGGGGAVSHKIIPFLVDYIVQNSHIDPKISKIIQHSEILMPDTDGPLSSNTKN